MHLSAVSALGEAFIVFFLIGIHTLVGFFHIFSDIISAVVIAAAYGKAACVFGIRIAADTLDGAFKLRIIHI